MIESEERLRTLWELHDNVQNTLQKYRDPIDHMRKAKQADLVAVLALAERIAPSSFAPTGWQEGLPLLNAFAPAPQPEQMRIGKLSLFNLELDRRISEQPKIILPEETTTKENRIARLKEKLKTTKIGDISKKMEVSSANAPQDDRNVFPIDEKKKSEEIIELPSNNRKVNISFAMPESESEEEDEEEQD
jgi:hypothetical protein